MKTLRVSGHKDYVAVDEIEENKITSTPFYLKKGETQIVKWRDREEHKTTKTEIRISDDFTKLQLKDIDENSDWQGQEWESEFDELLTELVLK